MTHDEYIEIAVNAAKANADLYSEPARGYLGLGIDMAASNLKLALMAAKDEADEDKEPDAHPVDPSPLERALPLDRMPLESLVAIMSACALHATERLAQRNRGDFEHEDFHPNREFADRNAEPLLRLADLWDRG